jgi:type I restriction enzyme S subunit
LPKGWKWVKLGAMYHTTNGGTPSTREPKYYNGKISSLKSEELDKGLITDTEEKISEKAIKNSSAKIFPNGTLLIALKQVTKAVLRAITNATLVVAPDGNDCHFFVEIKF